MTKHVEYHDKHVQGQNDCLNFDLQSFARSQRNLAISQQQARSLLFSYLKASCRVLVELTTAHLSESEPRTVRFLIGCSDNGLSDKRHYYKPDPNREFGLVPT
ncbi:hypothetical protein RRG08_065872 [Elysia crispata]|uniref:Uncharacterized protein n=1 Tax=Elysia crispata TaxID=231223 RepID=A0AAE1A7X2_9GAST|nr:hypothetical protein RRG08_065872 [Elysia crispata]